MNIRIMKLVDIPVVFICPDHNEKYRERKEHMFKLLTTIGFKNIEHHKSGSEQYPTCLVHATNAVLTKYLDDNPVLVIEDDVELYEPISSDFKIEFPENTDAFYLGFSKWGGHPTKNIYGDFAETTLVNDTFIRIQNMLSTHAIVYITKRFKQAVIDTLTVIQDIPKYNTDVAISRIQSSYFVYGLKYPIFFQSKRFGNTLDVQISTKYDIRNTETTVITAFFPIQKHKHTIEKYKIWAKQFFQACTSPVVCFTTPEYVQIFKEYVSVHMQQNILFVGTLLHHWNTPRLHVWDNQLSLDPESSIHSTDLYRIWAVKQELVCCVVQHNLFHSSSFVWCDIGCFRDMSIFPGNPSFATIPRELQNQHSWFACLAVPDLLRIKVSSNVNMPSSMQTVYTVPIQTIGGGVLLGDKEGWIQFSRAYKQELQEMHSKNEFIGKDQLVYRNIIFGNKLPGITVYPIEARNDYFKNRSSDPWFYLTYVFSGIAQ
jgi:hypothetical protein